MLCPKTALKVRTTCQSFSANQYFIWKVSVIFWSFRWENGAHILPFSCFCRHRDPCIRQHRRPPFSHSNLQKMTYNFWFKYRFVLKFWNLVRTSSTNFGRKKGVREMGNPVFVLGDTLDSNTYNISGSTLVVPDTIFIPTCNTLFSVGNLSAIVHEHTEIHSATSE